MCATMKSVRTGRPAIVGRDGERLRAYRVFLFPYQWFALNSGRDHSAQIREMIDRKIARRKAR